MRRPGELIRAVRIPCRSAALTAFHKVAKRRFDDISSVAVGFALDVRRRGWSRARIGLGGVAATPIRALATEARSWAGRGREETARRQPCWRRRARRWTTSGPAPRTARRCSGPLLKLSRPTRPRRAGGGAGMSTLPPARLDPVVGEPLAHESAALHVTGAALYTDDLAARTRACSRLARAVAARARPRHAPRRPPALDVPGVVRVLTAADVPGRQRRRRQARRAAVPHRGDVPRPRRVWVLAETLEAARLGAAAVEVDYEPLPSIVTVREAIEADSFQGVRSHTMGRGDADAASPGAARVRGRVEIAGQEHFYLETHASLALVDEVGQVFVQSSTQHPSETQEIVAHVLGLPSHEVTVQCLRMGGGFGGKEMQPTGSPRSRPSAPRLTGRPVRVRLNRAQDMTMTGKRHRFHAQWRAGFDDDGRMLALDATLTSDGGWSLDLSEPVLARALCHVDNAYWIPQRRGVTAGSRRPTRRRRPRSAASADRRGCS